MTEQPKRKQLKVIEPVGELFAKVEDYRKYHVMKLLKSSNNDMTEVLHRMAR